MRKTKVKTKADAAIHGQPIKMKAHYKKGGLRIILEFTIYTATEFMVEAEKLLNEGWTQVRPDEV